MCVCVCVMDVIPGVMGFHFESIKAHLTAWLQLMQLPCRTARVCERYGVCFDSA